MNYPWLNAPLAEMGARLAEGRLPHALLVSGPPGIGKLAFANNLARLLLCEARPSLQSACGTCAGCALFEAGSHPDYSWVRPAEGSETLKIDQIRAMTEMLALSSHRAGWKIAVLEPAEAMNINAANSLLKTLEEPTDNTLLVLVSAVPARLPATIRSRCQVLRLAVPDAALARDWLSKQVHGIDADLYLRLAAGAPLAALDLAERQVLDVRREQLTALHAVLDGTVDPLQLAERWSRDESLQPLYWMRDWLMDLVRLCSGAPAESLHNVDLVGMLERTARGLDVRCLLEQLESINQSLRVADRVLNRQLLTEDILLAWAAQR